MKTKDCLDLTYIKLRLLAIIIILSVTITG